MRFIINLLTLSLAIILFTNYVFAQQAEWAKNFPGAGLNEGYAVAADDNGNLYTAGRFNGTIDFDPGAGTHTLTSGTTMDAFVSKLDASGNFVWALQFAGNDPSFIKDIAVDLNGDLIVTGYFSGTIDIDLGAGTNLITATGGKDGFIAKLSDAGTLLWIKQIGGTTIANNVEPFRMALDASGNIHVAGSFEGSNVNFNPDGIHNLSSNGSEDIFVLKLTNDGNFTWAKRAGGTLSDIGIGIAVDNNSNVLVTGYFTGTANFNPSGTANLTAINQEDAYLLKFDATGIFQWVKQFGGTNLVAGNRIVCDNNNNIYMQGGFYGSANLNPDGVLNVTSGGAEDGFVVKLQPDGTFVWANLLSDANNISSNGLAIDENNNYYIAGNFNGAPDFDPSANTNIVTTLGENDVYLAKYNEDGVFQWVYRAGSADIERAWDVYYKSGALYITGYFAGTANFDVGGTGLFLTATGSRDIFVAKIRECFPTSSTDTQTACESYTWIDGNTYTASNNTATFTLTNAAGCDSIVTLNLTINNATNSTDTQTACDSYTWIDGNTYTSSNNTASHTLSNAAGCDSIITLNLTINNATSSTDTQTACSNYTWINGNTYTAGNNTATFTLTTAAGCDSIVTLNLTINNTSSSTDTKTFCESYTWIDGNTYTASNNTATFTLTNAAGCDSVVTLNLTINPEYQITIDTTINSGGSIEIGGIIYSSAGNYISTLNTQAGCDSIVTLNLSIVSSLYDIGINSLKVYPNPVKNVLHLEGDFFNAILYDINGKQIAEWKGTETILNIPNIQTGMYFLSVTSQNGRLVKKLLKE